MTPEGPSTTPSNPDAEPANLFAYAPVVSSVEPNSGPASGGTKVTISGSGFKSPLFRCLCGPFVESVQFGETSLSCGLPFGPAAPACSPIAFEVISDNEITAISPPGTGLVNLFVRTAGGVSPISPNAQFRYESAVVPRDQSPVAASATTSSHDEEVRACLAKARRAFYAARKAANRKQGRTRARALRHARKGKRKRFRACLARSPCRSQPAHHDK